MFWSMFACDMERVLAEQPPDTWDSFPLFQVLNDYLRMDGKMCPRLLWSVTWNLIPKYFVSITFSNPTFHSSQIISRTDASITNYKRFSHLSSFATWISWNPRLPNRYTRASRRRGGRVKGKFKRAWCLLTVCRFLPCFFFISLLIFHFHNHCRIWTHEICTLMETNS